MQILYNRKMEKNPAPYAITVMEKIKPMVSVGEKSVKISAL